MADDNKLFVKTLTTEHASATEALQVCFRLRGISGPAQGLDSGPLSDTVTVGSANSVDLSIADPSVSRHHLRITFVEDRITITDLDSTNGTQVNGVPISVAYLLPGSVIRLGKSELLFDLTGDYSPVQLSPDVEFGRLFGQSAVMRRLFAVLERAAQVQSTVLIQGESGTGKELIAESLHDCGPRRDGPFVVVDCAAMVPSLVESELFGHERGAFTGAQSSRAGAFERAHGGTLFLDEIGELDLTLQPRLLRAIENRRTRRIGSNTYRSFDARIIAATNRDLQRMVSTNDFREDLYYRLSVLRVHSPSLRERREDIELLARRFLTQILPTPDAADALLTDEVARTLARRHWPGNVRELRNFVERLSALGSADRALESDSSSDPDGDADPADLLSHSYSEARELAVARFEKEYARQALERSGGNVAKAAREIGIDRVYLFRLIRKHGLRKG